MESSEYKQESLDLPQELTDREAELRRSFELVPEEIQRRRNEELEEKYPGITHVFYALLNSIPWEPKTQPSEFPIAAAVVRPVTKKDYSGREYPTLEIVSQSTNMVKHTGMSSNHAEKFVVEDALEKLGTEHLPEDYLVVSTVEPCSMCAGVIANADTRTVIYGASQDDIRGKQVYVNGEFKPHRAEPEGYDVGTFMNEHRHDENQEITVEGGCCRNQVLSRMELVGYMHTVKPFNLDQDDLHEQVRDRVDHWINYHKHEFDIPDRQRVPRLDRNQLFDDPEYAKFLKEGQT